jgi:hypothetical protein
MNKEQNVNQNLKFNNENVFDKSDERKFYSFALENFY